MNIPSNTELLTTEWGIYINIPWSEHENWNRVNKEILTRLDAKNFIWMDDLEIERYLNRLLKVDISSREWITQVNNIFIQWVNRARTKRPKIAKKYDKLEFTTKSEIVNFCKETNNKTTWAKTNCFILRQISIVEDILSNPELHELRKKSIYVVEEILSKHMQITTVEKWNTYKWFFSFYLDNKNPYVIDFTLKVRSKDDESTMSKIWRDPTYNSSKKVNDWIWLTFFTRNNEQLTVLMQYISQIIYYSWDIETCFWEEQDLKNCSYDTRQNFSIENKSLYWDELLEIQKKWMFNQGFFEYLLIRSLEKWFTEDELEKKSKEKWTSLNYWDVKIKTRVWTPLPWDLEKIDPVLFPVWIEIKFVSLDEKNDDWLSFQPIYWMTKDITEAIRLNNLDTEWYVTWEFIDDLVEDFFKNLDIIITKKNKLLLPNKQKTRDSLLTEIWIALKEKWYIEWKRIKEKKYDEIEIRNWIKKYMKNDRWFFKVDIKWKSKKWIFYTNRRWFNLSSAWYYPKMEKSDWKE